MDFESKSLTKIYLRIVTDVQTLAEAFDSCIVSDDRLLKHNAVDFGKIADDAFLYYGLIDNGVVSNADAGADDGVFDFAILSDINGGDENRVF